MKLLHGMLDPLDPLSPKFALNYIHSENLLEMGPKIIIFGLKPHGNIPPGRS